jgi:hypothetical protein
MYYFCYRCYLTKKNQYLKKCKSMSNFAHLLTDYSMLNIIKIALFLILKFFMSKKKFI